MLAIYCVILILHGLIRPSLVWLPTCCSFCRSQETNQRPLVGPIDCTKASFWVVHFSQQGECCFHRLWRMEITRTATGYKRKRFDLFLFFPSARDDSSVRRWRRPGRARVWRRPVLSVAVPILSGAARSSPAPSPSSPAPSPSSSPYWSPRRESLSLPLLGCRSRSGLDADDFRHPLDKQVSFLGLTSSFPSIHV